MIEFTSLLFLGKNLTEWSKTFFRGIRFKSWILLFIFSSLWVLKRYLFFIHLFYFLQKQGPNGKKTSA